MNQFFYKKIEENFEEVKKNCFEHFYNIDKYSEEFIDFFEAQLKQIGMILYKNELFKNLGIVKNIKGAGYPNLEKIFREICFQIDVSPNERNRRNFYNFFDEAFQLYKNAFIDEIASNINKEFDENLNVYTFGRSEGFWGFKYKEFFLHQKTLENTFELKENKLFLSLKEKIKNLSKEEESNLFLSFKNNWYDEIISHFYKENHWNYTQEFYDFFSIKQDGILGKFLIYLNKTIQKAENPEFWISELLTKESLINILLERKSGF